MQRGEINENIIIKSATSEHAQIGGYASVFGVIDSHNDIITKGAFKEAKPHEIRLLWQHDYTKPIGVIKKLQEDNHGLRIEAEINARTALGQETIELIRQKAVLGLSIGFNIKSAGYNNAGQRIIEEISLLEISVVTFPANKDAQIHHVKKKSKEYQMEEQEIVNKISDMERKMEQISNYFVRPDHNFTIEETRGELADYIRKGVIGGNLQKSSLSGAADHGEVLLTTTLYNKIIGNMMEKSPMRRLASVERISTSYLDVVIGDGKFDTGWIGETEARDDTDVPKLLQKKIAVHELFAQPKATQRLIDDSAINIEQWIIERLTDAFTKAENEAFIHGDGNKKPFGIFTGNRIEIINGGGTVTTELLMHMVSKLPETYLANATFLMNRTTLAAIQMLTDKLGQFVWQQSLSDPLKSTIFGIPVVCCSHMPNIGKDNIAVVLGDFRAAYKIVDREDLHFMRDPYTDKPFVKFYAVKRVGGDVVDNEALKFAKFA